MRGNDTTHAPAGKTTAISTARHLRRMIRKLFGAPVRVHHYRDLHTRMLRDALCRLDCEDDDEVEPKNLCA